MFPVEINLIYYQIINLFVAYSYIIRTLFVYIRIMYIFTTN